MHREQRENEKTHLVHVKSSHRCKQLKLLIKNFIHNWQIKWSLGEYSQFIVDKHNHLLHTNLSHCKRKIITSFFFFFSWITLKLQTLTLKLYNWKSHYTHLPNRNNNNYNNNEISVHKWTTSSSNHSTATSSFGPISDNK